MAAEIINLRQARKGKARSEKERAAEQNRISFGRTKQEKTLTKALNAKAASKLDAGKLEKPNSSDN
jgi:hypothetical protein